MADFPAMPLWTDAFIADGWMTPDTYANHFAEIPKSSGVYMFVTISGLMPDDGPITREIIYVGMSQNLRQRVYFHEVIRYEPSWCQRWFKKIDMDICGLLSEERRLIRKFQPRYNIIGKQTPIRRLVGAS